MGKQYTIWSDDIYSDEAARNVELEWLKEAEEDPERELSDEEWATRCGWQLEDEMCNLDRKIDGVIVAFCDLGFWNGRRQGTKIFGGKIKDILTVSEDHNEWWGDGDNIRASLAHHDATHYILYRVAKDMEEAERVAAKIYNGDIDEAGFRKMTRSLYPYVAEIYGWDRKKFRTPNKWAV